VERGVKNEPWARTRVLGPSALVVCRTQFHDLGDSDQVKYSRAIVKRRGRKERSDLLQRRRQSGPAQSRAVKTCS
jgi:hypothetical protein